MTAVAQKTVLTGCLAPIDKGGLEQLIANSKANPKVIKTLKCKTVAEGKFRHANYIRNLAPQELYIEKHLMGLMGGATIHNPYWPTWMAAAGDNPRTYQLVRRYMSRPAEELYHTAADPAEMTNLAGKPEHAAIRKKLSAELDRWLAAQSDPGIPLDTVEAHAAAKRGHHSFPGKP